MNIYVSGRLNDPSVSVMMRLLEAHHHHITFDWTRFRSADLTSVPKFKQGLAEDERQGVWDADVLIVNNVTEGGVGCWLEVGLALSHSIPVILFGECRESLFWALPDVERISNPKWLLDRLAQMSDAL
jgi:hypothetical protein